MAFRPVFDETCFTAVVLLDLRAFRRKKRNSEEDDFELGYLCKALIFAMCRFIQLQLDF
jgi:hypothetical protein